MTIYMLAFENDDGYVPLRFFGFKPTAEEIAREITYYITPPYDEVIRMQCAVELAKYGLAFNGAKQIVLEQHPIITKEQQ